MGLNVDLFPMSAYNLTFAPRAVPGTPSNSFRKQYLHAEDLRNEVHASLENPNLESTTYSHVKRRMAAKNIGKELRVQISQKYVCVRMHICQDVSLAKDLLWSQHPTRRFRRARVF